MWFWVDIRSYIEEIKQKCPKDNYAVGIHSWVQRYTNNWRVAAWVGDRQSPPYM